MPLTAWTRLPVLLCALAPTCAHCKCKIVGHGAEKDGTFYCCAHCAAQAGVTGLDDRV